MINFIKILEESFDTKPTNIKKFVDDREVYKHTDYYFSFGDLSDYVVHFVLDKTTQKVDIYFENISEDSSSPMGVTGTGNSMKVFSTVIYLIYQFVQENEVNQLLFAAAKEDESRAKLYDRIIGKFAQKENFIVDRTEDNDYINFLLKRNNEKNQNI